MNSDAGSEATDAGDDLTDGGYVHRSDGSVAADQSSESSGFGRKGWLLVAAVVFSTLLVPGLIYLRPAGPAHLGFGFRAAMLVLPLLPAVLLGFVAVWSMTAAE
ncbi:hypothetical protein ACFQJD_13010 [Haloplanus sp. GCM10025708]|uniref:hypothetical protein n=1 Tax=Haloferacaceae TaxID=1644056 RepID=UPI0036077E33